MISRRGLLAAMLASAALPACGEVMTSSPRPKLRGDGRSDGKAAPGQKAAVTTDAEALVQAAKLTGTVGFVLMDAKTGAVLEGREAGTALPPASVTKAVTALYALERLGAGRRFATRLLATGPVQGGVIQGDLVLAGGGDATLQTDQLGDLAARLAKRGVRGVSGRLLYWEGALPYAARIAADQPDQVGYNPALSGLNLNFNRVHFEWKKAGADWSVAMDARGERFIPQVSMVGMKVASRETPLYTYKGGASREDWTVASGALGKGGSRWLPVRLTGLYTAEVFRTLAKAQGVTLPEGQAVQALPRGDELARVESEALPEVLRGMLRWSTNITAECSGLSASGAGSIAASGQAMTAWVRQSFGVGASFADHSGLGGASRISAQDMAQILLRAARDGRGLKPILRDVGMKDAQGKVIKGHPVKVMAKSGTLNFVSALAGYITPPGGREMIFAIFTGDPARRDAVPVAARENPPGSEAWISRSRKLQGQLISRWASLYA
ncbi:D-alanyl-D-alanine carboxypeptidase/D-alanyl-D-alanine-endopeptidase [Gemmobacter sp. 24YEA27]|uniref:D-alanyl-D-alanine carboxypeptidase/D-alanyl-D-alanine endopeptidase n=1 Tax=Gemmobacter sp. 24YEA27 TaxID=3040672 RepID=UPI0024B393CB|nr:D-alanyl-D-alanine carboxypeptidase/D-alanyl-D-alanine-endopeptidase [Gemmobacter sp. 24YEA27]